MLVRLLTQKPWQMSTAALPKYSSLGAKSSEHAMLWDCHAESDANLTQTMELRT